MYRLEFGAIAWPLGEGSRRLAGGVLVVLAVAVLLVVLAATGAISTYDHNSSPCGCSYGPKLSSATQ